MPEMPNLSNLSLLGPLLFVAAFGVLVLGYFFIFWDQRKDDSEQKGDAQVGLKLALFAIGMVGLGIAAGAVGDLLGYLLSGAKPDSSVLKKAVAGIVSGGGGVAAVLFLFLPRTNHNEYPKAERFAVGAIAVIAGIASLTALSGFVEAILMGKAAGPWAVKAYLLGDLLVSGGLAFLAIMRFGTMSSWAAPARPVMQAPGMHPGMHPGMQQQQGMHPGMQQQQGMHPGGGYPPQGGQMPPGGGYPPQGGGGLPPPGGGYPPQGGGGYPPR